MSGRAIRRLADPYPRRKSAHTRKTDEHKMSRLLPQDVEDFLYELATHRDGDPDAFEEYAKTAAALLWEKYCVFEDPSIQIMPCHTANSSPSSKWRN